MRAMVVMATLVLVGPARAAPPRIEAVYAVSAGPDGITVRVASKGCARKADFTAAVSKQGEAPLVLFVRRRLEACAPAPPGHADLDYSYRELGLQPGEAFVLGNPLIREPPAAP